MKVRPSLKARLPHQLMLLAALACARPALAELPARPIAAVETAVAADKLVVASGAYQRWQSALSAFSKADRERQPVSDAVLFVGSSTIRLWSNLSDDFRQVPVIINRGFGGSTMADCNSLVRELVTQYKPRQVLVYAGDNDLAEGRSPEEVLKSFSDFVRSVRSELPVTRIAYISIKPSPLRASLMPAARKTNALISAFIRTQPEFISYIDVFNPMLNEQGQPRAELFLGDRLHMNAAGYQLWQSVIVSHLPAPQALLLPAPQLVASPLRR
ncbi:MAG: SGNH/GDSL hydrolase family protein [Pseudomonadota bacterium]